MMNPRDHEQLIDVSFRFVSWLRRNFPEVKDSLLEYYVYDSFGECIRQTPTLFWGLVGDQSYDVLMKKSENGESIFDRVMALIKTSSPAVQNEMICGFMEGHMNPRPDSSLEKEMWEVLGHKVGFR